MSKLNKVLYTAKVHTTGGRDGGRSQSDDGLLAVNLTMPGSKGEGTNPEQLLAAGWSSCYLSAIRILAGKKRITLPEDVSIDIEVDLGLNGGAHGLAARFHVNLPGLDPQAAQDLVDGAHQICPYSRGFHGNMDVTSEVLTALAVAA